MTWTAATQAALELAQDRIIESYLGQDPNITGVGVGFRQRGGVLTDEPVVSVLVAKKRPEALVSRGRLLPRTVEVDSRGWGVDVIEAGPFVLGGDTLASAPPAPAQAALVIGERMRPPRQGCSISNYLAGSDLAGTYGCNVVDLTDNTLCLLSCNHVLARHNLANPGEIIIQPGSADGAHDPANGIARLKRFHPLTADPTIGNDTDAAIAQLEGQTATNEVARDLMAPISPDHPAVGSIIGGDLGSNVMLTVMDTTLQRLGVRLAGATGSSSATTQPQPGMAIEKVGRTTGYTSSRILAVNVASWVTSAPHLGTILYRGLVYTPSFGSPGDSGAVACEGGDGETLVPPRQRCVLLGTVSDYYEIPLTDDNDLVDQLRDEFLAQSLTGHLLITATYVNQQVVIDRLEGQHGRDLEVSYAQEFYAKYRDFIAAVLADPSSDAVVTSENLDDAWFISHGLSQTVLIPEEWNAVYTLNEEVLANTQGMNRRQVVEYLNDPTVAQRVYDVLASVPTIALHGPITLGD